MRSILRLKRVYAEKYGSIRGYKAGWAKSGIAPLPDLRFDVLRTRGDVGLPPKPAWGFHPQTPSPLRGGFNDFCGKVRQIR